METMDQPANSLHEAALAAAITLTVISQLLMRMGARHHGRALSGFLNPWTIGGYSLFGAVVLLMVFAMQEITLRSAMAWASLSYTVTPLAAKLLLKDHLNSRMAVGSLVVGLGVLVFFS